MAVALPFIAMGMTAISAKQKGDADHAAAVSEAKQLDRNRIASIAEGTRASQEIHRQGDVIKGDAKAAMAAGGGTTTSVGATKILSDIDSVTDYNALSAIFESESKGDQLKFAANMRRREGRDARKQGNMKAVTSIVSDGAKMYGATRPTPRLQSHTNPPSSRRAH